MHCDNPLLPPRANDSDIVAVLHFGPGYLYLPRTRREMLRMDARAVMRPSRGWHRVLRSFQCEGGIVFEPRVKYSAEQLRRYETAWLSGL